MSEIHYYKPKKNRKKDDSVTAIDAYKMAVGSQSLKKVIKKVLPLSDDEDFDELTNKAKSIAEMRESMSMTTENPDDARKVNDESGIEIAKHAFNELSYVYALTPDKYDEAQALSIVQNWRDGGMAKWIWAYQLTETTSSVAVQAKGLTFGAGFVRKALWRLIKGQMLAGKTGADLAKLSEKKMAQEAARAAKIANPSKLRSIFGKVAKIGGRAFNWIAGVSFVVDLANETVFYPALSDIQKYVDSLIGTATILRSDEAFKALLDEFHEVCPKKYEALITDSPLGIRALQESENISQAVFQALGTVKTR